MSERILLVHSTGSERFDAALRDLIARYDERFPGRMRACFISGSVADDTAVATSDLDVTMIFSGHFATEAERHAARQLCATCVEQSAVELDAAVIDEASLRAGMSPMLKLAGRLVSGEDIREHFPIISITAWTRDRMHAACWLLMRLFARPSVVRLPLRYPDATAEFLGYDSRTVRLSDSSEVHCTRDLIRTTGWAATALIALKAGRYVARKQECHGMYREVIGDEWSDLLRDIYDNCRTRWQYLLPEDEADRLQLREICERTLSFENHFLAVYKGYLLAELRGADTEGQRLAARRLADIPLADADIVDALADMADGGDAALRRHAAESLRKVRLDSVTG